MMNVLGNPAAARSLLPNQRPLRILHVTPSYLPAVRYGGPIRSVHGLARSLVSRGHAVHVFTSSMDGPSNLQVPENEPVEMDGVLVHYFRVPALRRLCWCPSLLRRLKREADSFDVMHLHSVFLWPTNAAARVASRVGLPYLLAPRGMLGPAVIRSKSRHVKGAWIRLFEHRTLRDAAGIHVTTELEEREIRDVNLGLAPFFCVPNSIRWPATYPSLEAGPFASLPRPYVLFLSRIDPKKGLDRLIEAWKWLPELTLLVAGNDEQGYSKELDRLARGHGVRERIRFIGPVSDASKWALFEGASMLALTSYSENFGNVVAEAMAMGCPVLVTPEVGLASLVQRSGAGIVVDGDPAGIAAAIRSLSHDIVRRRSMGESGRFAARRYLSEDAVGKQMESVYRRICETAAKARLPA
jgi:glycosyltransferase involved in cell wall biosynthesis